ncbi:hypothetical protein OIU34_19835 [Pararhizobium sp. BT-229]|uniref:hypothetical protein n=1 Tax=Pararhizobium sp. BT-229 TaxID=2986923 RepID=UPI0021F6C1A2|nr:hypothetical protein [Pararhizobium sp. BT-229]MCV9964137.1 hypothetical protein [Pararhizobium sp. BT-229]
MLITFEVPVIVEAKPGRAVNERIVFGYEAVTVDVPILSAQDAPVALRYTRIEGVEGRAEEFRGFGGCLYHDIPAQPSPRVGDQYQKYRSPDGLFDLQMAAATNTVDRMEKRSGSSAYKQMHPNSFADAMRRRVGQYKLEPLRDMDLRGDTVEQAITDQVADFRHRIRGMVIIENRFHLPEPEPLLALVPVWAGNVECRVVRAGEPPSSLAKQGLEVQCLGYFRFDEMDRLEREAPILANGGTVERRVRDIEIADPSVLVADTDTLTLIGLAHTFAQFFAASLVVDEGLERDAERTDWMVAALSRLPVEQFALYKSLLHGIEIARVSGDTEELEGAVSRIVESPTGSVERRTFVYGNDIPRHAREIVRRWNDREVRLDPGFGPSWKP